MTPRRASHRRRGSPPGSAGGGASRWAWPASPCGPRPAPRAYPAARAWAARFPPPCRPRRSAAAPWPGSCCRCCRRRCWPPRAWPASCCSASPRATSGSRPPSRCRSGAGRGARGGARRGPRGAGAAALGAAGGVPALRAPLPAGPGSPVPGGASGETRCRSPSLESTRLSNPNPPGAARGAGEGLFPAARCASGSGPRTPDPGWTRAPTGHISSGLSLDLVGRSGSGEASPLPGGPASEQLLSRGPGAGWGWGVVRPGGSQAQPPESSGFRGAGRAWRARGMGQGRPRWLWQEGRSEPKASARRGGGARWAGRLGWQASLVGEDWGGPSPPAPPRAPGPVLRPSAGWNPGLWGQVQGSGTCKLTCLEGGGRPSPSVLQA